MKVSFVIPCYQEEDALPALRPHLVDIAAEELVFVDDGSTDATAGALAAIAADDPRVRVVTHERNRGVGAAMRSGIDAATGDVIVVYDADATYPLADAQKLVAAVREGYDVATATPFAAGGGLDDVPAFRRFLSRAAVSAYRVVLGRRARNISVFTCAFRAYRAGRVQALSFRADGFPAAAEILGRLVLDDARVTEVPSTLSARTAGVSKMRVGRAAAGHLATLSRLLWARVVS